jgi:uncharacterized spore protein YtfJ
MEQKMGTITEELRKLVKTNTILTSQTKPHFINIGGN